MNKSFIQSHAASITFHGAAIILPITFSKLNSDILVDAQLAHPWEVTLPFSSRVTPNTLSKTQLIPDFKRSNGAPIKSPTKAPTPSPSFPIMVCASLSIKALIPSNAENTSPIG